MEQNGLLKTTKPGTDIVIETTISFLDYCDVVETLREWGQPELAQKIGDLRGNANCDVKITLEVIESE